MKHFFYIQIIIACVHCCEEYLLTDLSRNKLVHIGLDFSTCKEYEIKFEALKFLIAGVINDNITIYWINDESFVKFSSFDDSGNFQPAKKIDVKKDKISTFEISPNFSKLFIATNDGIYEYDIDTNLLSDVLKNQFISGLTVFDEKQIFYSVCNNNNKKGYLKTYDVGKRSEIDEAATEFCPKGVGYDQGNDILFTYFDNGIYERNVKDKSLVLRYINPNAIICSMAVGVKHLFFVAYNEGRKLNDIYKMPIVPRPIATTLPIDYTSLPHVSVNEGKVIVLDVGGDQIMRLNRFNEIEKKWNVEIKNKNIISFKSSSPKLFWINRENEGVVITVDLTADQLQTAELKFENLNGQHLVDIEPYTNGNTAYLATSYKIYEGTIDDLKTKEIADIDNEVKSMKLKPEEKILYVSGCKDDKGYISKLDYNENDLKQNSKQIEICLQKFDMDEEKNIYGATSNRIYFIEKDLNNNIVKLCDANDVKSLVIHKAHIYFISSNYKTSDKRLFRIKKEPALKSEDILTFQTEPAALTFIKKIPNMDDMKMKLLKSSSSPLQAKISSVLFIIILMRLVSRSSPINSN